MNEKLAKTKSRYDDLVNKQKRLEEVFASLMWLTERQGVLSSHPLKQSDLVLCFLMLGVDKNKCM